MTDSGEEHRLLQFGSATIYEAWAECEALPPRIKALDPDMLLAGRAVPVVCAPGDNTQLHYALAEAQPGQVLVVGVGGAPEHAYWGELMTHAAQARGLAGLVLDGCVRDSRQLRELGFPVFCTGLTIAGAAKTWSRPARQAGEVRLGAVTVRLGDVVIGDADGVVVVPGSAVREVADAAERRQQREEYILTQLGNGATLLELLGPEADQRGAKP
jgi:4-hydroxy-4-methyl-2-oxoglutarate aldolase